MSLVKTDLNQIYEFYIWEVSYWKDTRGKGGIRENLQLWENGLEVLSFQFFLGLM